MASLFKIGFQKEAWKPMLGVVEDTIVKTIQEGTETYRAYAEKEAAEAQAEAAKAEAEAAKAQAAAAAAAAAVAAGSQEKKIFGIPASYLLWGGLGLGILGAVIVLAKNK